jgi:RHS repeat-associated protein
VTTTNGAASSRHRYGGEELDATGLYYHRARYYHSDLGRYINRDSFAGDMGSPVTGRNRYAYVGANPVRYTDPSGHFFEEFFDAGLSLSVGVMLLLNGGNTAAVAEQIKQAVQEHPIVAGMVGRVAEKGQEQIARDFVQTSGELALRNSPLVGTGIGLGEAVVGRDVFSGRELSEGERYLNVIFAGTELAAVAKLAAREVGTAAGSIGREAKLGAAGAEPGGVGRGSRGAGELPSANELAPSARNDVADVGQSATVGGCSFDAQTPVATIEGERAIG